MNNIKSYWLHSLTPLHVGVGRGVSFIDLPIMREKSTGWPIVPGSAVKGVWRDYFVYKNEVKILIETAFGKETKGQDENAGSVVLTDSRLVLLPIRSFYGTFAYTTSPLVLKRLKRDLEYAGKTNIPSIPEVQDGHALLPQGIQSQIVSNNNTIYLEELDLKSQASSDAFNWADYLAKVIFEDTSWQQILKERFVIFSNTTFDFFCEMGTEVNARIRIEDDTKVVKEGALWYEESLPAESVLTGLVWCDRVFGKNGVNSEKIFTTLFQNEFTCQIGGKASIGKGQVHCRFQ